MTDPTATAALKAVAEAVTGPGTPDSAAVTAKPPETALRMLALAGPALSALIAWVIAIIGGGLALGGFIIIAPLDWPETVAVRRIEALGALGMALCAILAVVVFRLASGGLKRIEARAGPAGLTVETDD